MRKHAVGCINNFLPLYPARDLADVCSWDPALCPPPPLSPPARDLVWQYGRDNSRDVAKPPLRRSCRLPRREQEPLEQLLPQLLAALDAAKADPSEDVRRLVCQALVLLLDVAIEQLEPAMPQLVTFMLSASADADKLVALEASEFWSSLCETRCAVSACGMQHAAGREAVIESGIRCSRASAPSVARRAMRRAAHRPT